MYVPMGLEVFVKMKVENEIHNYIQREQGRTEDR